MIVRFRTRYQWNRYTWNPLGERNAKENLKVQHFNSNARPLYANTSKIKHRRESFLKTRQMTTRKRPETEEHGGTVLLLRGNYWDAPSSHSSFFLPSSLPGSNLHLCIWTHICKGKKNEREREMFKRGVRRQRLIKDLQGLLTISLFLSSLSLSLSTGLYTFHTPPITNGPSVGARISRENYCALIQNTRTYIFLIQKLLLTGPPTKHINNRYREMADRYLTRRSLFLGRRNMKREGG